MTEKVEEIRVAKVKIVLDAGFQKIKRQLSLWLLPWRLNEGNLLWRL